MNSYIQYLSTDWKTIIEEYDFTEIDKELEKQYQLVDGVSNIYPPKDKIFNCFDHFNLDNLKVVILGQDPYINEGEAMGLSFSVPEDIKIPRSLANIFKEIGVQRSGDLTDWAQQGVLLLNTALTVEAGKSGSHKKIWKEFTNFVINYISNKRQNIVFLLWGNHALSKKKFIDESKHCILTSGHPSPLNFKRDFIGNQHFSKTNTYLVENGIEEIKWI